MPRVCQIEDKLLTSKHETLQRTRASFLFYSHTHISHKIQRSRNTGSKTFETGLLLAQVGGKADALLRFVPTPEQDDGKPPSAVDASWMLEHAAQVARMLPGGIAVLGCYVFATNAKLAKVEAALQPMLATLAKRLDPSVAERQSLLLLLPSDAKKTTCRALPAGAARLQPMELKSLNAPPPLVCLCADWSVDVPLTLKAAPDAATQRSQLTSQLKPHADLLTEGLATVGGSFPSPSQLVSQLLPASCGSLDKPHRVALYASAPGPLPRAARKGAGDEEDDEEDGEEEADDDDDEAAMTRLVGTIHGRCFVSPKDDAAAAVSCLKRDLISSLNARVSLFFEQLDEEDDEEDGPAAGALAVDESGTHALPRRAHVKVAGVPFSVCDYLAADDEPSDCAERLNALLSIDMGDGGDDADLGPEASASALLSVMPAAAAAPAAPKATAATISRSTSGGADASEYVGGVSPAVLALIVALIVAVIAVVVMMAMGGGSGEPAKLVEETVAAAAMEDAAPVELDAAAAQPEGAAAEM